MIGINLTDSPSCFMRVLTCTPVAFGGGPDFFARDSGLLCRGFQALGHECQAVMPLPRGEDDQQDDLIRTEFENLEDECWWRIQQPDLVVLYAWGRPRYRHVARAIRRSGAFLVLNQDNGGLVSPLAGFWPWLREQWILGGQGKDVPSWIRCVRSTLRRGLFGLAVTDPLRAEHLSHGHVIACVSPKAAESYRRLCKIYRGEELARKVEVIPHAVEPQFRFTDGEKRRMVVCVGRWEDKVQKRPELLCQTVSGLLEKDPRVLVTIVGHESEELRRWHLALPPAARERVFMLGNINRDRLVAICRESRVFHSPSAFESFGIAAAEALCCGCSVVAERSVSMSSFDWFVSEDSGTLAHTSDPCSHVEALLRELDAWDMGHRDPRAISTLWSSRFHADKVAAQILGLMNR